MIQGRIFRFKNINQNWAVAAQHNYVFDTDSGSDWNNHSHDNPDYVINDLSLKITTFDYMSQCPNKRYLIGKNLNLQRSLNKW